ncbi:MAG: hypothetical protein WCE21_05035 [Candidatus Babeliales bacterium]
MNTYMMVVLACFGAASVNTCAMDIDALEKALNNEVNAWEEFMSSTGEDQEFIMTNVTSFPQRIEKMKQPSKLQEELPAFKQLVQQVFDKHTTVIDKATKSRQENNITILAQNWDQFITNMEESQAAVSTLLQKLS